MSVLTLVRHAQASYMSQNYDRLSPAGEVQSRKLGEYWVYRGIQFDRVFTGPSVRHVTTERIVAAVFSEAGLEWANPVVVPEMDEFDAYQMMKAILPVVEQRDDRVAHLNATFYRHKDSPEAGQHLQRLFEAVARHWSSGEFEVPDLESWSEFRARVASGIRRIKELTGRGARAAVFTSGGPIAATMGMAMDLAPPHVMELLWMSRNCSVSEFLFNDERFSLHSFNSLPHLQEPELVTYR